MSSFNNLPEELILEILSHLEISELISCSKVCKALFRLVKDSSLWKCVFVEIKSTEATPKPRLWCSSAVYDGKMYFYGGHACSEQSNVIRDVKSDFYAYDLEKKEWKELSIEQENRMDGLTEHKCVSYDNCLWFVGGYNGFSYCNHIYRFDPVSQTTEKIVTFGEAFSPRSALTICVYNNMLYTFGGWNGFRKEWYNDIHKFDFNTFEWKRVIPHGKLPSKRTSHSAVVYKNCMYVFAGYSGEHYLNDIHEFNFDTETWTDITPTCRGTFPEPRSRFCAAVYKNHMFIIGGWNKVGYYSDYYSFNLDTRIWMKIKSNKHETPSLSQYSCAIYENKDKIPIMYLFGGFCAKEKSMVNKLFLHRILIDDDGDSKEPPLKKSKISLIQDGSQMEE